MSFIKLFRFLYYFHLLDCISHALCYNFTRKGGGLMTNVDVFWIFMLDYAKNGVFGGTPMTIINCTILPPARELWKLKERQFCYRRVCVF